MASKTDGTLWVWGRGENGELGLNNTTNYSSPVQIPGTNWNTATINHKACTKTDGTLWTWGFNTWGQIGDNNRASPGIISSPKQIPGTTWAEAAIADITAIARKTDGTLWMWGYNSYGILNTSQTGSTGSRSSPVQVGSGSDWDKIATSNLANFAAVYAGNTSGQLFSWGHGGFNALGQGNTSDITTGPQVIGSATTWDKIPIGGWGAHGAIKTDGTLWTWGMSGNGQTGQNNNTAYNDPTQVGTDTGYTTISASYRSMIVTKKA